MRRAQKHTRRVGAPVHRHRQSVSYVDAPQRATHAVHHGPALDGGKRDSGSHGSCERRKRRVWCLRTRLARRREAETARCYENRSGCGPAVDTRVSRRRLAHATGEEGGAQLWRQTAARRSPEPARAGFSFGAAAMSDDEDGELEALRRAARSAALPGAAGDRLEELRRRAAASRGGSDAYFDDGDEHGAGGAAAGAGAARGSGGSAYARPGDDDDDDDDDDDPVRAQRKPRSVLAALAACCCARAALASTNPKRVRPLAPPFRRRRRPSPSWS